MPFTTHFFWCFNLEVNNEGKDHSRQEYKYRKKNHRTLESSQLTRKPSDRKPGGEGRAQVKALRLMISVVIFCQPYYILKAFMYDFVWVEDSHSLKEKNLKTTGLDF